LTRLLQAIRSFFSILFSGRLPADVAAALGLVKAGPKTAPRPPEPSIRPADGALQLLAILQRDSRLVDFLMEDVSGYSDEQVGAAVRSLHEQCRQAITRYLRLSPVIDGVEGTYTKVESPDPARVKFIGNLPAKGTPGGGTLRHKGWQAEKIDLPPVDRRHDLSVIAPAEIEVE
jgi:hypothetical protein